LQWEVYMEVEFRHMLFQATAMMISAVKFWGSSFHVRDKNWGLFLLFLN
jgi:hypothetical protein